MIPKKMQCPVTKKKKFPTKLHARIQTINIEHRCGKVLYAYKCPHCKSWHLTRKIQFTELLEINL